MPGAMNFMGVKVRTARFHLEVLCGAVSGTAGLLTNTVRKKKFLWRVPGASFEVAVFAAVDCLAPREAVVMIWSPQAAVKFRLLLGWERDLQCPWQFIRQRSGRRVGLCLGT